MSACYTLGSLYLLETKVYGEYGRLDAEIGMSALPIFTTSGLVYGS